MNTRQRKLFIWSAPAVLIGAMIALAAFGYWAEQAQAQSEPPPPPPPPDGDIARPDPGGPAQACPGDRARDRVRDRDRARSGLEGAPPRDGGFDRPQPPPEGRYGARGPEDRGSYGRGGQGYGRGGYAQRGNFEGPPPRWQGDWREDSRGRMGPPPRMGRGGFGDGPGFGPPPGRPQQGWGRGGPREDFDGPRGPRPPDPETVFNDMDANGDQSISKDEFLKFHEEHRPPFGPPPGRAMGDRPPRLERPEE